MNTAQYEYALTQIKDTARACTVSLNKKFVEENNPYKVGDIISDHYHTIKIESWAVHKPFARDTPEAFYKGLEVTKKGVPKKRQSHPFMYQSNIVK